MALKSASGLSRRDLTEIKGFEPILPELGKIKIGEKGQLHKSSKSGSQFQPPQKLDHFKVTGLERGPDNNLLIDRELHKIIGDKPRELDIVFPYNDIDLNFLTFYAWYSSRTIRCKGNGEVAFRLDDKTGNYVEMECDPATCPMHTPPEPKSEKVKRTPAVCKPNGILSVILMKAPRLGGVYKFRTTSFNTVRNVRSSLMMIRQLTGGTLAGIPLKLTLKPQTVNPKTMKGSIIVYVVSVEWVGTLEQLFAKALESAGMRAKSLTDLRNFEDQARLALTAGPEEDAQEAHEVAEEFYPDAVEAELVKEGVIEGEIVEPSGDQAEKPAQEAQEPAQEPEGGPGGGESPPVEIYSEEPPPNLMDEFPGGEAPPETPGDETPPPEEKKPPVDESKNRKTNKSKKRRI